MGNLRFWLAMDHRSDVEAMGKVERVVGLGGISYIVSEKGEDR